MKRTIYLLVAILLLAACIQSVKSPTSVVAITPSIATTVTSVPTSTQLLTTTPITPTTTISAISTPSLTLTITPPNFNSILTAQVSWNICDGAREPYYETDLSPDGSWLTVACDPHDPSKFNGAKFVKLNGDIIWDISFYDAYGTFQDSARVIL